MTKITQNKLKELLDYNPATGMFIWKITPNNRVIKGSVAGCICDSDRYLRIRVNHTLYSAARLAWLCVYGEWPKNQIDHINHIRRDNRIINLRVCSNIENQRNQRLPKNNASGYMGVSWDNSRAKWLSQIRVRGKTVHLGRFNNINDAITSRALANSKYGFHENHGKYLRPSG